MQLDLNQATLVARAQAEGLARHLALAVEVRALLHAMSGARPDDMSLDQVADRVRAARRLLESSPFEAGHIRAVEGRLTGLGKLSELGPFTGQLHAIAPPMRIILSSDRVEAFATYGSAHQGAPGIVHGGMIAGAFDELLGVVQRGHVRMTVELKITYCGPARLGKELRYTAWLDRVQGRKAFVAGTLHDGDVLCAESSAIFVAPKQALYSIPPKADTASSS
jgi:acyl-coenzyme A thioesterase PaaI-like protein